VDAASGPEESVEGLRARLEECEVRIERAALSFIEAGDALQEIHDKQLYLGTYTTFERYVEQRWDFERAHAYRLMDAANVARRLSPVGDIGSERVARALLSIKDEKQREIVWKELQALRTPIKGPSASHVQKVAEALKNAPPGVQIREYVRRAVALARQGKQELKDESQSEPETTAQDQRPFQFLSAVAAINQLPPADELYGLIPQHAWDQLEVLGPVIQKLMRVRKLWNDEREVAF
jgi:hypothetical protein